LFANSDLKRYSLGTKNRDLKYNPDGSLTIYVQADPPADALRANWLPAPKNADFSLFVRAYWPKAAVLNMCGRRHPCNERKAQSVVSKGALSAFQEQLSRLLNSRARIVGQLRL
jgi:hypothetical protein